MSVPYSIREKEYKESFFTSAKVLVDEGYLPVSNYSFTRSDITKKSDDEDEDEFENADLNLSIDKLKKGREI